MCEPPVTEFLSSTTAIAALRCSDLSFDDCVGICPNADLAGIGVRVAFYVQSVMNTLLVVFSPHDAVPSAWASTLLTGALIIAAIVQKVNTQLTLHHAILIMNFATLSCISSLACAPMLPIWRLTSSEYYARELSRRAFADAKHEEHILESGVYINKHKKEIKAAQNRERVIISLALLTQVVLQWAWGIILFVSPVYNQTECSGDTVLMFFLHPFTAREINRAPKFVVWPLWLLFSLGTTLVLTVVLALSSPSRAHDTFSSRTTISAGAHSSPTSPVLIQLARLAISNLPPWRDRAKQLIFWGNVISVALWVMYLVSSEWQIKANCIFQGENTFSGFGQITAGLLALTPLWSLTVALYKYPSLRRRQDRHRLREQRRLSEPRLSEEAQGLLSTTGHPAHPFDAHPQDLPGEAIEMQIQRRVVPHGADESVSASGSIWRGTVYGNGVHVVAIPDSRTGFLEWMESRYLQDTPP